MTTPDASGTPSTCGSAARHWRCGPHLLSLHRPLLMGIVNVTPDSFSDGGRYRDPQAAAAHALQLIDEGADLLDIGGESTRPGAAAVAAEDELDRVLPVFDRLRGCGVPLSIDTRRSGVMRAALAAGAAIVNDVRALREPEALQVVATSTCGVVLMHMLGEPQTMQAAPHYSDVVAEVVRFLRTRVDTALSAGIAAERIALDPGFGFGKSVAHNYALLRDLPALVALGQPVLVGLSRKSMLGAVTGHGVQERGAASVAAALLAIERGARIVRVHDVAATRDALRVWRATTLGEW